VGAHFIYDGASISSHSYVPGPSPEPLMRMHDGLDEHESNVFRSLARLDSEIGLACRMVSDIKPDLMLLDGSLWLVPSDRPPSSSPLSGAYADLVALHKRLYSLCDQAGTILCGVIKDTRARRLSEAHGERCSDSVLLSYALEEGECTAPMPYSESEGKEPEGFRDRIKYAYLKPSEHDLPLRIEYLDSGTDPSGMVMALSALSPSFAYPAILVEADMRAAMDGREMDAVNGTLISLGLRALRRDSRPFR